MIKLALGFASVTLLTLCCGAGSASAFVVSPALSAPTASLVTPVAMCGRTCSNGGRYIPGPPGVCAQNGLEYCGSSRGGGGGGGGVGVGIPGTGIGVYVTPPPASNCRTITVERADGSVRRTQRCD